MKRIAPIGRKEKKCQDGSGQRDKESHREKKLICQHAAAEEKREKGGTRTSILIGKERKKITAIATGRFCTNKFTPASSRGGEKEGTGEKQQRSARKKGKGTLSIEKRSRRRLPGGTFMKTESKKEKEDGKNHNMRCRGEKLPPWTSAGSSGGLK